MPNKLEEIPAGRMEVFGTVKALRWLPGVARVPKGYTFVQGNYVALTCRTPEGMLVRYRAKRDRS